MSQLSVFIQKEYGLKAVNLFLDLPDTLQDSNNSRTSPTDHLTSLVTQDIHPLPIKIPHTWKVVQDSIIDTPVPLLFDDTSTSNVISPQGIVIMAIRKRVGMPMTSGHSFICKLDFAENHLINDLRKDSVN